MKKFWIAVLLFSQVFFTLTSVEVLASALTTVIGGQVVVGPWLSGWDNRVKITIDHNDIGGIMYGFPMLIYLSSSSGRNIHTTVGLTGSDQEVYASSGGGLAGNHDWSGDLTGNGQYRVKVYIETTS